MMSLKTCFLFFTFSCLPSTHFTVSHQKNSGPPCHGSRVAISVLTSHIHTIPCKRREKVIFRSLHKRKEYFPFRNSLASLALLWLIPSISRWGIRIYQLWSQLHSNYKVGKEAHKNSQRKYGLPLRRGNGHWVRKKKYSHRTCPLIILHTLLSRIYIYNYWPIFTFDLESQFSLRSLFLNVSSHFINIL